MLARWNRCTGTERGNTSGPSDPVPVSASVQAVGVDSAAITPPVSPMGAFFRSLVLPGWGQVAGRSARTGSVLFRGRGRQSVDVVQDERETQGGEGGGTL